MPEPEKLTSGEKVILLMLCQLCEGLNISRTVSPRHVRDAVEQDLDAAQLAAEVLAALTPRVIQVGYGAEES